MPGYGFILYCLFDGFLEGLDTSSGFYLYPGLFDHFSSDEYSVGSHYLSLRGCYESFIPQLSFDEAYSDAVCAHERLPGLIFDCFHEGIFTFDTDIPAAFSGFF